MRTQAKARKLPIVKVFWADAHQHASGWMEQDEFQEWLREPGIMVSVGVMISRDKQWLVLAMSLGFDSVSDCLKIPAGMVKKVVHLGWLKETERNLVL